MSLIEGRAEEQQGRDQQDPLLVRHPYGAGAADRTTGRAISRCLSRQGTQLLYRSLSDLQVYAAGTERAAVCTQWTESDRVLSRRKLLIKLILISFLLVLDIPLRHLNLIDDTWWTEIHAAA